MKNDQEDFKTVYVMKTVENPTKLKKDIKQFERILAENPDDEQSKRMLKKRLDQLSAYEEKNSKKSSSSVDK